MEKNRIKHLEQNLNAIQSNYNNLYNSQIKSIQDLQAQLNYLCHYLNIQRVQFPTLIQYSPIPKKGFWNRIWKAIRNR
jgi:hypothetical protein